MDDFEPIIRELRAMDTIAIKALAKRAKVNWVTVYRLATGRTTNPLRRTMARIRIALGHA